MPRPGAGESGDLGTRVIGALDEEFLAGEVSLSFRAWMLGRLLLASRQCSDVAAEAIFEKYLREVLDEVVASRLRAGLEPEEVADPCEAWAWSYPGRPIGARAVPLAEGGSDGPGRSGVPCSRRAQRRRTRGYCRRLRAPARASALSAQRSCGTIASWRGPPPAPSLQQRCEAADRLLRHGVSDRGAILEGQLGLEEALRSVPRADFRAWAVGLARLSEVQTAISSRRESSVHLQCSPLSDLFFEAVEESPHPGDKALGLANWLYASYVAWWHQSSNTECPLRKNKDLRRRAAVTPSSPRADASGALTCRLGMASMDIANYSRLETMC
ncbi:unnamed protein product [Prorocentrum cordatum]|uniref:Nuclear pore complex protein Nup85 n=1 Tax=Prorocentrum cordatum TaxID=2364126 RepID=A0ABN9TZZ3_9DINO|nr:unnamed protein product [Polarella glacialis]